MGGDYSQGIPGSRGGHFCKGGKKKAELRFKAYCDQLSDLGVTITDCSLETFLEADSCRAVGTVNGEEAIGILGGS